MQRQALVVGLDDRLQERIDIQHLAVLQALEDAQQGADGKGHDGDVMFAPVMRSIVLRSLLVRVTGTGGALTAPAGIACTDMM